MATTTALSTSAAGTTIPGITPIAASAETSQARRTSALGVSTSLAASVEPETRKRKPSPTTTSRKSKGKADAPRIRVGGRARCLRKHLFHILETEAQKDCIRQFTNNYQCYGTIKSGNSNAGYTVVFDLLPEGAKDVFVKCTILVAVSNNTEDPIYT